MNARDAFHDFAGLVEQKTEKVPQAPTCGCCRAWVDHIRKAEFDADVQDVDQDQFWTLKDRLQISSELSGCHTATIDGNFVEGHVRASDIERLLAERPDARGLTVPGMPMGSPGMDFSTSREPYDTLLVGRHDATMVLTRHS